MTNCLVSLLFVTCVRQLCSDGLKARYPVVAMFAHAQTFDSSFRENSLRILKQVDFFR